MITYKLYELTKSKYPTIGETKEIIKNEPTKPILEIIKENADIELTYISDIPNDRIEDELYIISLLAESDNYTKKNFEICLISSLNIVLFLLLLIFKYSFI